MLLMSFLCMSLGLLRYSWVRMFWLCSSLCCTILWIYVLSISISCSVLVSSLVL